jgi:two-component system, sensor histidine kinase
MERLVADLLDLSRISAGTLAMRVTRIDLREALRDALEANGPLLHSRRHEIVESIPDTALCVEADRVRLAQVFGNILTNAAKYTPAGGRIEITVARTDPDAEISIRDNGTGMAPEVLPTIFDTFARAPHSQEQDGDGMGIGLTIVKRIVEMHGGSIIARSDGIGQGSEFIVRLPLGK